MVIRLPVASDDIQLSTANIQGVSDNWIPISSHLDAWLAWPHRPQSETAKAHNAQYIATVHANRCALDIPAEDSRLDW